RGRGSGTESASAGAAVSATKATTARARPVRAVSHLAIPLSTSRPEFNRPAYRDGLWLFRDPAESCADSRGDATNCSVLVVTALTPAAATGSADFRAATARNRPLPESGFRAFRRGWAGRRCHRSPSA